MTKQFDFDASSAGYNLFRYCCAIPNFWVSGRYLLVRFIVCSGITSSCSSDKRYDSRKITNKRLRRHVLSVVCLSQPTAKLRGTFPISPVLFPKMMSTFYAVLLAFFVANCVATRPAGPFSFLNSFRHPTSNLAPTGNIGKQTLSETLHRCKVTHLLAAMYV